MTSPLLRRTLFTGATALALTFSAAAVAFTFNFGSSAGEQVKGDGKPLREARNVDGFEAIRLAGHFDVVVRQAPTARLSLEGDGNLLPYVETRVVDGHKGKVLEIGVKRGYNLYAKQPLKVEVDMATLRALAIAGSGKAEIASFKVGALDLSVAGSGTVLARQLQADKLSVNVSGSGDVVVDGRSTELGVSIAGSGDVKTGELVADEVKVSIAGSGDASVQANRKLKVSIAGSGDVRYSGNAEVSSSIAGSGSVKKL
jgi:hypothetical protein